MVFASPVKSGANCNGLPCEINPTKGFNQLTAGDFAEGVGDEAFCAVTSPNGVTATIEMFEVGQGSSSGSGYSSSSISAAGSNSSSAPGYGPNQDSLNVFSSESSRSDSSSTQAASTSAPSTTSVFGIIDFKSSKH